jgi:hypothetical protein
MVGGRSLICMIYILEHCSLSMSYIWNLGIFLLFFLSLRFDVSQCPAILLIPYEFGFYSNNSWFTQGNALLRSQGIPLMCFVLLRSHKILSMNL